MDITNFSFPLFENLLRGNLNPLHAENADGIHFKKRIQDQIEVSVKKTGNYRLIFPHSFNLKTRYYAGLIIRETEAYITDMCEMIRNETNSSIRSYYRDQILDKHLTNCLLRLGRHLQDNKLFISYLIETDACNDIERKSNVFVLHLLKVCLAKSFLEIQLALKDVISIQLTEKQLYTTLAGDNLPAYSFLKIAQNTNLSTETQQDNQHQNSPPKPYSNQISTKEVLSQLGVSDSTLLRYQKAKDFPMPNKVGRQNLYNQSEIDNWKEKNKK
jgi:predicted DNA-binding transcriptional regulator AlpA